MPRSTQAIYTFGGGVLAPSMEMRADIEVYGRAMRDCRNWLVTPQGGILKRHGFEYISEQAATGGVARLFTLDRGGNESDILVEMDEGSQRYWLEDGLLQDSGMTDIQTDNDYTWQMLPDVQAVNQENLFVSVHPDTPPLYTTVISKDEIISEPIPAAAIPRTVFNDTFSPNVVSQQVVYQVVFSPSFQDGDQFWFIYNGKINSGGNATEPLIIDYSYSSNSTNMIAELIRCCEQNADISRIQFDVSTTGADTYEIELTGFLAGKQMNLPIIGGSADNVITVTTPGGTIAAVEEPAWSYPLVVENGGSFYQCIQPNLADATNAPGTGANWTDFWVLLAGEPFWYQWQHAGNNPWQTDNVYGPWGRGFPRTVTFHQQRLYFGGSVSSFLGGLDVTPSGAPAAPATIWGSRIGEFTDFQTGPNDSDPVQFTLSTRGIPAISWMTSLQGLLVGTTNGHYRVSAEITITPSTINAEKQNGARSAIATPVNINNRVFSIQLGRRTIHAAAYSREALAILADDVSIGARQLFESPTEDLALMQVPEDVVFGVRNDGGIVGMSYNPETEITAWWEWDTQGQFEDIAVIFDQRTQREELYVMTTRDGVNPSIEKTIYPLRDFNVTNLDGFCWLDAFYRDTITDSNTITGVPARFEGQTVRVTVNDADYGEFVVSGGQIVLPTVVTGYVYVGYSVNSMAETFERDQGNPQGVSFGTARRWNKLYSRLISSALPIINGERSADRTPASQMDLPEDLRTEDMRVHNLGYNDGSIRIEQDLPFPTHVVGLYGQVGTYDA